MSIYIGYMPSDMRLAHRLALDLMKRGFKVWVEQPDLDGQPVDPQKRRFDIIQGIAQSEVFILVLSPTAMAWPDLFEQLDLAVQRNRRLIVAERQETALTKAVERQLAGAQRLDFSRARYDQALAELVVMLGGDLDAVPDTAAISVEEPEKWLPGEWEMKFINQERHVDGIGQFKFEADGKAVGLVVVMHGQVRIELRVLGKWQFLGERFSIQGQSKMSMSIEDAVLPERMTYLLSLRIVDLQLGQFNALSSVGDRVIFRKIEPAGEHTTASGTIQTQE